MFSGWEVELSERRKIYQVIRPIYNDIYWQYLVCQYGANAAPLATCGEVVGWYDNHEGQQLVLFSIDGSLHRPDGRYFHLSWSRDHVLMGRKPLQSYTPLEIVDWQQIEPFTVDLVPKLFALR